MLYPIYLRKSPAHNAHTAGQQWEPAGVHYLSEWAARRKRPVDCPRTKALFAHTIFRDYTPDERTFFHPRRSALPGDAANVHALCLSQISLTVRSSSRIDATMAVPSLYYLIALCTLFFYFLFWLARLSPFWSVHRFLRVDNYVQPLSLWSNALISNFSSLVTTLCF